MIHILLNPVDNYYASYGCNLIDAYYFVSIWHANNMISLGNAFVFIVEQIVWTYHVFFRMLVTTGLQEFDFDVNTPLSAGSGGYYSSMRIGTNHL